MNLLCYGGLTIYQTILSLFIFFQDPRFVINLGVYGENHFIGSLHSGICPMSALLWSNGTVERSPSLQNWDEKLPGCAKTLLIVYWLDIIWGLLIFPLLGSCIILNFDLLSCHLLNKLQLSYLNLRMVLGEVKTILCPLWTGSIPLRGL